MKIVVLSPDEEPNPHKGTWIAFAGDTSVVGHSISDAISGLKGVLLLKGRIESIHVMTGPQAETYLAINGDPRYPLPVGILNN